MGGDVGGPRRQAVEVEDLAVDPVLGEHLASGVGQRLAKQSTIHRRQLEVIR